MAEKNNHNRLHVREPLSDTQMLMYISIGIFAAMYIAAMLTLKGGFLKPQMIFDLINDNAALIIISCALTIVMIGGGINISVGGVIGLTVMSCALFLNSNADGNSAVSILLTLLLALGIGLAFGVLQGFLVSHLEIQPFIVTMAGMFFCRGMTAVICTEQVSITEQSSPLFYAWANTKIRLPFGSYINSKGVEVIPYIRPSVVIALLVLAFTFFMLRFTKLGRTFYAIGGNATSAAMMGLNVKKTKMRAYMLSSILCSIGAICYCLNTMAGSVSQALGLEMDAISSAVIGGTLLTGGVGNVIGSFFGVLINGTISSIVKTNGKLASSWPNILTAALLFVFIVIQSLFALVRRMKSR